MTIPFQTPTLSPARETQLRHWLQAEAAAALLDQSAPARPGAPRPGARAVRPEQRRTRPAVRRLVLGVGVAAAVTAAVVLQPGEPGTPTGPAAAAAGVTFSSSGEALLAEITDPEASAAAMTAAFAERGLDIRVTLIPSTPMLVGTVLMTASDPELGTIDAVAPRPGCTTAGGAPCSTAVQVSADFSGFGEVAIGRAPHDGEPVEAS